MSKYLLDDSQQAQLENNFTYHPPKGDQLERYDLIRREAKMLAKTIMSNTVKSREQSLALLNKNFSRGMHEGNSQTPTV